MRTSLKYLGIFFFLISESCFADIIINGNHNINTPTTYSNVTLDMSNGRFTVNTGGALNIQNSTINVTISPTNPFFTTLTNGSLMMHNNTVNVSVNGIASNPNTPSMNPLINIQQGTVDLSGNNFAVSTPFTVSALQTQNTTTSGFNIVNNTFSQFHGGLYLNNSNSATVTGNMFTSVSFASIWHSGNLSTFNKNIILFPGNLNTGDAIDIVNANADNINNNTISSGVNYGIFVMGGQNISIDNNQISDGLSYGIFIQTPSSLMAEKHKYLSKLLFKPNVKIHFISNKNISITNNYLTQNRYGLAGGVVDQLIVTGNTFIQRFSDSSVRQYWTNNDILLPFASNLIWVNNFYKEAFAQDMPGDNTKCLEFVTFPAHGGVFIP